jgi:hypothetical protein
MKIEWSLPDKPEVAAIAKHCDIAQDSALGKLIRVFAWYNEVLTLVNKRVVVSKDAVNKIAANRNFADAMLAVGWLIERGDELEVAKFAVHNGAIAKVRAQTYLRIAKRRTASVYTKSPVLIPTPTTTNSTTKDNCTSQEACQHDLYTQGEKNADGDVYTHGAYTEHIAPEWLPMQAWEAFIEMRRRLGKPMTAYAQELAVAKLGRLRAYGHDPQMVLEQSIAGSWTGLYEIKPEKGNGAAAAAGGFAERDYSVGASNVDEIPWFRDGDGSKKT